MILPNLLAPLTEQIDGNDYMRVPVERQEAWMVTNPAPAGYPPLLEWFIQPGDEHFVTLPSPVSAPKPARKPRTYRSSESLRAERDRVQAKMGKFIGTEDTPDRAAANLSPHARSKAAARAGRRRFARMDRDLERYTALRNRLANLDARVTAAERREVARAAEDRPRGH